MKTISPQILAKIAQPATIEKFISSPTGFRCSFWTPHDGRIQKLSIEEMKVLGDFKALQHPDDPVWQGSAIRGDTVSTIFFGDEVDNLGRKLTFLCRWKLLFAGNAYKELKDAIEEAAAIRRSALVFANGDGRNPRDNPQGSSADRS